MSSLSCLRQERRKNKAIQLTHIFRPHIKERITTYRYISLFDVHTVLYLYVYVCVIHIMFNGDCF